MDDMEQTKSTALDNAEGELVKLRSERIAELLKEALDDPDALHANLIAGACAYMRFTARLESLITETLVDNCGSLTDVRKLTGALDLHLKMTRQYDRLIGLATRQKRKTQTEN